MSEKSIESFVYCDSLSCEYLLDLNEFLRYQISAKLILIEAWLFIFEQTITIMSLSLVNFNSFKWMSHLLSQSTDGWVGWLGGNFYDVIFDCFLFVERQLKTREKQQWATTAQSTIEQSEKNILLINFYAFSVGKKSDLNSFEREFAVVGG